MSSIEEHEITLQEKNATFKYSFNFNAPMIQSGYVTISANNIEIKFPSKESVKSNSANHNFHLFINNKLIFSNSWLPFYTVQDSYKIYNMLHKTYTEFLKNFKFNNYNHDVNYIDNLNNICNYGSPNELFYCDDIQSSIDNEYFSINCFENTLITSVEIYLKKFNFNNNISIPKTEEEINCNLQIFIGENLILCLKRDFVNLSNYHIYFLVSFILYKLLQYF